jgi:predicted methyltransferase
VSKLTIPTAFVAGTGKRRAYKEDFRRRVRRMPALTGRTSGTALSIVLAIFVGGCGGSDKPVPIPPHIEIPAAPAPTAPTPCPSSTPRGNAASESPAAPDPNHPPAEPLIVPTDVSTIIDAADRTEADRQLDAGRHPGELLTFLALAPGMRAAELVAGTGYTTELIARTVGPKGKVWAENPAGFLKFVGVPYKERLARPVMKNVVRADRPIDAPFPPEAKNLDAVVSVLVYHDTVWLGVDRDKMNKAAFDALRRGGEYVIVDHSAAPGHGIDDVKTLHRIEEDVVRKEVVKAGFQPAGSANFLRNPDDSRDWNDAPNAAAEKRGTSDRFVLRFVRP